jgi:hypothetical protein
MSATILRMPRRRVRSGNRSRLVQLGDMVAAIRKAARGLEHTAELEVLLIYVKCDPPAHQLAAELSILPTEAASRLRRASALMRSDPRFGDAFHAINSRLE